LPLYAGDDVDVLLNRAGADLLPQKKLLVLGIQVPSPGAEIVKKKIPRKYSDFDLEIKGKNLLAGALTQRGRTHH
jgi:hypothetical protein